jgi:hypothetical protein
MSDSGVTLHPLSLRRALSTPRFAVFASLDLERFTAPPRVYLSKEVNIHARAQARMILNRIRGESENSRKGAKFAKKGKHSSPSANARFSWRSWRAKMLFSLLNIKGDASRQNAKRA